MIIFTDGNTVSSPPAAVLTPSSANSTTSPKRACTLASFPHFQASIYIQLQVAKAKAEMHNEAAMPAQGPGRRYGMNPMGPAYDPANDVALRAHQNAVNAVQGTALMEDNIVGSLVGQFGGLNIPTGGTMPSLGPFVGTSDGIIYGGTYGSHVHAVYPEHHQYGTASFPMHLPGSFAANAFGPTMIPYTTPGRAVPFADRIPREIPNLENRRASYSTSGTESTPATPFFGNNTDRGRVNGPRVVPIERSSYHTPSPREPVGSYMNMGLRGASKHILDPEIERLLMKDPPIPRAVPAVWTEMTKPLEQCLENRIQGNRNVYIRGLHPTTDDDLLHKYATRFGEVEQSKAILDTATGACKGFGFAKFKNVHDSEKCIRGFYRLGYEVGFARESFNARLKAEGDESSTNLYISNLPRDLDENMLIAIFEPFHIVSSKILRDSMGNSRGVGFARFDSRDVCEDIIRRFHNQPVGRDAYLMQIRYADTPAQKELKRITAERRQYRTNEYNIGAYGTHAVGMNPSIYSPALWTRRTASGSYQSGPPSPVGPTSRIATTGAFDGNRMEGGNDRAMAADMTVTPTGSDDGSGDEGVTVVDSPMVANGSTKSAPSPSPTVSKETS